MIVSDKACSFTFRSIIYSIYPTLNTNKAYAKFFEYLLLGTYRCKITGKLIISREILGQLENISKKTVTQRNYTGQTILDSFAAEILPITVYDYSYSEDLARTVEVDFPPAIQSALIAEYQGKWKDDKKVYFVSGEVYTTNTRKRERDNMRKIADTYMANNKKTGVLLSYLNSLPPHRFTKLLDNMKDAYKLLDDISNPVVFVQQYKLLRAIEDQSQPFYKPVDNTTRVFSLNESLLNLKGSIRKTLCKGWYDADLKSAQLAIIAVLWDIPYVYTMLTKTTGVWNYFLDYFGVDVQYRQQLKEAVKEPLYSCAYGMGRKNLQKMADMNLAEIGISQGGDMFMKSELIATILDARDKQTNMVRRHKGVYDAFGNHISTSDYNTRSILAQQAQSYELRLLWPAIELAMSTKDFMITAFMHDGCAFDFTRRSDSWIDRITSAVQEEADLLNIPTELEVTLL